MTSPSPTRLPAIERRSQLLDVAIDLFARKGFGGTTTKEIAAAAGVTEAIIFRHFATKQDLYKAILDARCNSPEAQAWLSEANHFMDKKDDEGLFRFLLTSIIGHSGKDPRFERLMLHAALEGHELAIMHHNQFKMPIGVKLIEYVAKRQKSGALRKCNPTALIFAVAGIATYYAQQKYLHKSAELPMSDKAAVDTFLAIIMKGIQ